MVVRIADSKSLDFTVVLVPLYKKFQDYKRPFEITIIILTFDSKKLHPLSK